MRYVVCNHIFLRSHLKTDENKYIKKKKKKKFIPGSPSYVLLRLLGSAAGKGRRPTSPSSFSKCRHGQEEDNERFQGKGVEVGVEVMETRVEEELLRYHSGPHLLLLLGDTRTTPERQEGKGGGGGGREKEGAWKQS